MADQRFIEFINQNRQPGAGGAVDVRGGIAKMRETKSSNSLKGQVHSVSGGVLRGMLEVPELPWNIINNAPKLVNLLPGEQGMGTLDEMGAKVGGPLGNAMAFMGKDPLVKLVEQVPGMQGLSTPDPENPITERVSEDIGTGIATLGAGTLFTGAKTGLAALLGRYVGQPAVQAPVRAVAGEVASSFGAEGGRQIADHYDVQNPLGRFALETVGSMTPSGVVDSVEAGGKRLLAREGADKSIEAMDRLGIRPSIGMTGNRMGAQLESGASSLPFFSAIPEKIREDQFGVFDTKLREAADNYRPNGAAADPTSLGEQVRDIAQGGADRMRSQFGQREDALQTAIGARTPIDVTRTRAAIEKMMPTVDPEMQSALQHELDLLDQMLVKNKTTTMQPKASSVLGPDGTPITVDAPVESVTATNTVPYEQFRSWRTNVGRRTDQPSIKGGQSKQLYKAITEDLQGAADSAGVGDDWRSLMADQAKAHDDVSGDITRMEGITNTPNNIERGNQYLTSAFKNPEKMMTLKQNAKPEEWAALTGNIVEHLGLATKGNQTAAGDAISPNKFLSNWADMDPRVKNMLFDDDIGTRQMLDDLALVAEDFKRRGLEANTSRTAGTGQAAQAITGVGAAVGTAIDPVTTIGGLTLTYATVKGLMSETLARWAANNGFTLKDKMTTKAITGAAKAADNTDEKRQRKFTPQPKPVDPLRITVRPSDNNR